MESSEFGTNRNFAGEPEWSRLHQPKFVCFRYLIFLKLKTKEKALPNVE